ncbi:hypothetical protein Taro_054095 [Colocasia esculenta]|uniref:CST complex subunit STN1 n=1 Tax=Colocasia esculenta TaxID=4460 RepID=A0A843XMU4_COLES|nr:hypothetical protein [Colocasia esculenta]
MDAIQSSHAKLLARDLLALTARPSCSSSSDPLTFSTRGGRPVSRAEAVGVVVTRDRRDKFLRFLLDDGTGCVPCILWLNYHHLLRLPAEGAAAAPAPIPRHLVGRSPSEIEMLGRVAEGHAERALLGALVRVRGRVTAYRGAVQLTVDGVAVERDPNAEALHWLQCFRLARRCYGMLPSPPPRPPPTGEFHPVTHASSVTVNKRKVPI